MRTFIVYLSANGTNFVSTEERKAPDSKKPNRQGVVFQGGEGEPVAYGYTEPNGARHLITTQSRYSAMVGLEVASVTVVEDQVFKGLFSKFLRATEAKTNSLNAFRLMHLLARHKVPCLSERQCEILMDESHHYRAALADLIYRRDLSDIAAILVVSRKRVPVFTPPASYGRQRHEKEQVILPECTNATHITKGTFGFREAEDAVSAKLAIQQESTVITIR